MSELISLEQIRTDGGTQPRAGLDQDTLAEYVRAYNAEADFPPIEVVYDGQNYWPSDGFHRIEAARLCGLKRIKAAVQQGTRRDAVLASVGANATHGLRRSNADKRRAVETLLRDPEWSQWSNREIARRCAVDDKTVGAIRKELSAEIPQIDERKVTRGDSEYTMQVPKASEAVPAATIITKTTQAGTYPLVDVVQAAADAALQMAIESFAPQPSQKGKEEEKHTEIHGLLPNEWYPVDMVNKQIVLTVVNASHQWPMHALPGRELEAFDFDVCTPGHWRANFGAKKGKNSGLVLNEWYAVRRGERAVLRDAMYSRSAAEEFIRHQLNKAWEVWGGVEVERLFTAPGAERKPGEWRVVDIHEARYWDAKTELSFEEWMAAQAADPVSVERDEDYGLPKAAPMAAPDFPIDDADDDEDVEVGVNEAATAQFSLPALEATWDEIENGLVEMLQGTTLALVRQFVFEKLQALDMEIGYEALR